MADIERRLAFIEEADRLKTVLRRTRLITENRQENSGEHSWHVALMALALKPHAPEGVDAARSIEMLLVHDLVEIDVGDTFAYDAAGTATKLDRERVAAARIFGLHSEGDRLKELWEEFEAGQTPDAAYAHAIDRFQPILLNFRTEGHAWREHGISRSQVLKRNAIIERGCPALWPVLLEIVEESVRRGYLVDG